MMNNTNGHASDFSIVNLDEWTRKLSKFKAEGPFSLVVVTDFDRYYKDKSGRITMGCSTHGAIQESAFVTQEFRDKCRDLLAKYLPIELDPNIEHTAKCAYMEEWWRITNDLLVQQHINKADLAQIAETAPVQFREGSKEFFDMLEQYNIPVLVLSAGVADMIEVLWERKLGSKIPSNLHIISNKAIWDGQGTLVGFREPIIHSLSKECFKIEPSAFTSLRKNMEIPTGWHVILLGDTLADSKMAGCLPYPGAVVELRMCFFGEDMEQYRAQYSGAFDALILRDGPMCYITQLIEAIVRKK